MLTNQKYKEIHTIKISYNSIRPRGERLKTFGGTASGHEPLKEMFEGIEKVLKSQIDPILKPLERVDDKYVKVRPIHILDIGNLIGNNVVVGGVRRTAEIFLCDSDDWEVILAKYGINGLWNKDNHEKVVEKLDNMGIETNWLKELPLFDVNARPLHHRRMSNNSIAFESKPSREMLELIFLIMQGEGEPGFVNLEAARKRRPNAEGLNPCAEILLDSYGVCNLTTVNVDAFVTQNKDGEYELNVDDLLHAQRLSVRAGLRMTTVDLELPHWDAIQKRDRLLGTSLTGWYDAMDKIGLGKEFESQLRTALKEFAKQEARHYAYVLRVPTPLLTTTIKPEGTLSQVAGGVSSGLHRSHAPYYIRRIRINANDPLVKVAQELNWTVNPEIGNDPDNPRTVVVDFPIKSGARVTKNDINVKDQFDTYFSFQREYTDHNSSITITVKDDEWDEALDIVYENWDEFVGVSFLSHDGGSYQLAPYEEIDEDKYNEMKFLMFPFDHTLLQKYEGGESDELDASFDADCATGSCPIR